ncbi:MAG: hypothetical protein LBQ60_17945 [Bacteroidales bacterium]|jgi:H+/Cl- antiporter ClcA|nr:hypothetical protein [Bacteroidales bacterium]
MVKYLKTAKNLFKSKWLIFLGIICGAVGGYIYWMQIGCFSGTCPITASPLYSTIAGAIIGGLFFDMFTKKESKSKQ